jgi:hypothetical protein
MKSIVKDKKARSERSESISREGKIQGTVRSLYFQIPLVVLCMSLMVLATYLGGRHLSALEDFRILEVDFTVFPTEGVKEELVRQVKDTRGILGKNLFEKDITRKVAKDLEKNPWVLKVHSSRRVFPNKLQVKLELRRPEAVFKKKEEFYLLDAEGTILPEKFYSWPKGQRKTPYIESARVAEVPGPGKRLEDKGVLAGIELVMFLKKNNAHKLLGIKAVDVSNVGRGRPRGESDIVLRTEGDVAIKWGCPPLCQQAGELSDSEKLNNLLSVVKAEGPRLAQMEYVDVRWQTPRGKRR